MRRVTLGAAVLLTALLIQGALLSRLPGPPDLVLVVVIAFGLAEGSASGAVTGFLAGLLVDVSADHELGRVALAYALAGHVAGLVQRRERSWLRPLAGAGAAAAVAVTTYALAGVLLGDPRTTIGAWLPAVAATVGWCVVLAVPVVPLVASLVRRLDR